MDKKMVYICVDIRDIMLKQVCNLNNQNIFIEKRKYTDTSMQTDLYSEKVRVFRPKLKEMVTTSTQTSTTENKEMEYINCIKQILNVNEKYVTLHVINDIKFPIFFTIKEIVDDGVIIKYVNITLSKRGDEKAIFVPIWDRIFKEMKILNGELYDTSLFNEKTQYIASHYFKIKNIVKSFYE